MSAEDRFFRSLQRHSRLRVDKIGQDLSSHQTPISDIYSSLIALESCQKALWPAAHDAAVQGTTSPYGLQHGFMNGAREMSKEWTTEEECAGEDHARRESSANSTTNPESAIRDSSFAARRRHRYRSISHSVRCVAPPDSPLSPPTDGDEAIEEPQGDQGTEMGDNMEEDTSKPLLQFRRIRKMDIARSTVEYLQLKARVKTASLLCSAVTTAEQEKRTKQRARIWRRDVGTMKARHVRALAFIEQQADHQLPIHHGAAEVLASILDRDRGVYLGFDEDKIAQRDSQVDRVYETLLKENGNSIRT